MRIVVSWMALLSIIGLSWTVAACPQQSELSPAPLPPPVPLSNQQQLEKEHPLQPFGANLFSGNFLSSRKDGINPNYVVMPGDKVAVYTWGSVRINQVYTVDSQGNIFVPEIGPVHLAGVKNSDLTETVKARLKRVYYKGFNAYTNLITANPVGVFVTGSVVRPGRYAGIPSDSALFFLDQAGGIDPNLGSYRSVVIIRNGEQLTEIDLYDFILSGKLDTPQFQDGDTILVQRRGSIIELHGNVARPSFVELKKETNTGADALAVIPKAAHATEVTIKGSRNGLPFNRTLSIAAFQHEPLVDGDMVTIRTDGRAGTIIVQFEGEFDGPGMLSVKRGSRLVDVLNLIPVDPAFANTRSVHIKRLSVAKAQKDAINDSLFRLERSALLALSSTAGGIAIRVKEAELTAKFVERARQIDPLGRVVTAQDGQQLNVLLEDGDVIVIPKKTNVVRVGGEVMMSQAVMHRPDLRAKDYIAMAGGYSNRADDDLVIVLHADASVSMESPRITIQPGDEILVPPKIDTKVWQGVMDVMQVIYQVAVSSAVVVSII